MHTVITSNMIRKPYQFAKDAINAANIEWAGFVTSMLPVRLKFRTSRSYGSMKSYYVRNR